MDTISLLRDQLRDAHWLLEETMKDVTPEQAHWSPPGRANPLGATYAHLVTSEDAIVNGMLKRSAPLAATTWAGKAGLSEPRPQGAEPWDQWARRLRLDLPALRQYAQAVYAASDEYVASLSEEGLSRTLDLSAIGLGDQQTLAWMLNNGIIGHARDHCGEVACLKGLQGAQGYPF